MAKGDELDTVIQDLKDEEDWQSLAEVLNAKNSLPAAYQRNKRREFMNEQIRHKAYGHLFMEPFREWYEPDYVEIVRATAKKLEIKVRDSYTINVLEEKILVEVIERAREEIIKKDGEDAWREVERQAEEHLKQLIAEGRIPAAEAEWLKGLGPGAMMAALVAGRLAGFGLYIVANQIFFAISRYLGLEIGVAIAGPIIGRVLSFLLGPAGFIIGAILLFYGLGDTNWKKTIGAAVMIAILRRKLEYGAIDQAVKDIGG